MTVIGIMKTGNGKLKQNGFSTRKSHVLYSCLCILHYAYSPKTPPNFVFAAFRAHLRRISIPFTVTRPTRVQHPRSSGLTRF